MLKKMKLRRKPQLRHSLVLIDLSMVSIVAVDLPLPIPNREVKPDNADDTTNVGK